MVAASFAETSTWHQVKTLNCWLGCGMVAAVRVPLAEIDAAAKRARLLSGRQK
jgi:hypothetical protein